jgi:hypothetical protein
MAPQACWDASVQRSVAIRPLMQSALAGVRAESDRFEDAAAQVTRLAGAPSAAETAETVRISPEARQVDANFDSALSSGLEGAMVDTRVAKYAFIANLKVLETGAEVEKTAAQLLKPKDKQ